MNATALIARLERAPLVISNLVGMMSPEGARFSPPSGAWSVLEILCHLGDEEVEDFRTRLRLTLEDPTAEWPPIDPEGWARARRYKERDLHSALARFMKERLTSVVWLKSLRSPDWNAAAKRPFGVMRAGDLLAAWAAHDALHIRQMAKRLYELAAEDGKPEGFAVRYAGEWGA